MSTAKGAGEMSVERIFYCDGPGCERHVQTARTRAESILTVTGDGPPLHFCGWDCVLRHAAAKEPETIVPGPGAAAD
jgi:hypothetical protein